jgi:C-terminal processing protease CtpA/Prc
LLESIRAEMAPSAKRVAAGGPAPSGRPRLGITIKAIETNDEDVWEIGDVLAGSPAEKAGLRPGDRFVAINGTPVKDLTVEERRQRLGAGKVKLTMQREGREIMVSIEAP